HAEGQVAKGATQLVEGTLGLPPLAGERPGWHGRVAGEAERRGGHVDDARTARRQAVGTTARHAGRRPAHLASTRAGLPAVAAPRLRRIARSSLYCRWSLEPSGT